jgi:Bacterial Ig domain
MTRPFGVAARSPLRVAATIAVLLTLVVVAPGASAQRTVGAAWIDEPIAGGRLPLGPVTVTAHATDASGVASIELYVDGALVDTQPATAAASPAGSTTSFAVATLSWTPPAAGGYRLAADGVGTDGTRTVSRVTYVFVGDVTAQATAEPTVPTPTPDTTRPHVAVSIDPSAPYTTSVVTFTAIAADAGGVAKIQIWVKFEPTSGGLHLFGKEQECLGTTTCSVARGPYGQTGVLSYYAMAWDAAGNVASTGTYTVNVSVEIK